MFFIKMILVVKLNSEFYVKNVVDLVNQLKGHVITIICDNNWTNQALFKKCHTVANKPSVNKSGLYLLLHFDYVHICKSIHKIWITEAC